VKIPFGRGPQVQATLTNVAEHPIDIITTAERDGGEGKPHYPCLTVKVQQPDGHYRNYLNLAKRHDRRYHNRMHANWIMAR